MSLCMFFSKHRCYQCVITPVEWDYIGSQIPITDLHCYMKQKLKMKHLHKLLQRQYWFTAIKISAVVVHTAAIIRYLPQGSVSVQLTLCMMSKPCCVSISLCFGAIKKVNHGTQGAINLHWQSSWPAQQTRNHINTTISKNSQYHWRMCRIILRLAYTGYSPRMHDYDVLKARQGKTRNGTTPS